MPRIAQSNRRKFVRPVWFEYSGTPTAVAVSVYYWDAVTAANVLLDPTTLPATQGIAITDLLVVQDSAGVTTAFHGASASTAGNRVGKGNLAANGGLLLGLSTPRYLPPQTTLKIDSTSRLDVSGTGFVYDGTD
jgi:hypothetical protein